MQLNSLLKSLLIALPMFTLAACSSTEDSGAGVQDQGAGANTLGTADQGLSADEQMRQKFSKLYIKRHFITLKVLKNVYIFQIQNVF